MPAINSAGIWYNIKPAVPTMFFICVAGDDSNPARYASLIMSLVLASHPRSAKVLIAFNEPFFSTAPSSFFASSSVMPASPSLASIVAASSLKRAKSNSPSILI